MYLEIGSKRVFAGALEWPGWCRSARDEEAALEAVAAYGRRYRTALRTAARGLKPPDDTSAFKVVERLRGDATTDFGAPSKAPSIDDRKLTESEAKRQATLLRASWAAFDRTAEGARDRTLRKGPRGGGRDLDAIVQHVMDADQAYLAKLGGRYRKPTTATSSQMTTLRKDLVDLFLSRGRGEPPPRIPRSGSLWSPRYFVRRSAWHALDHAWEIEDRAEST